MIFDLSALAVLTAAAFALIMHELREQPASFPGRVGVRAPHRDLAGEGLVAPLAPPASAPRAVVVIRGWHHNPVVHEWARVARRQAAGWRAQSAITAARAGREAAREAIRMAALVATVRARCAEPIPYLDVDWREATDSFKAFCGIEVA